MAGRRWKLIYVGASVSDANSGCQPKTELLGSVTFDKLSIKTTFIRCSSGGFKFGQKYVRTRNVPTPKFTHSLLHLQTAKKSLIFTDYRSLHVRKMKQSVGNLA